MDTPPFFYISWQAGVVSLGDCCMNIEWLLHASFRVSLFLIHWELGIGRDDISRLTVFDFLRTCRIVSRETCHFPSVPVMHDSSNLLSLLLGCLDYEQHRGFEGVSSGFWLPALSILLCFYWAFAHLLRQKKQNLSVFFAHFEVKLFGAFDVGIRSPSCKWSESSSFQSLYCGTL